MSGESAVYWGLGESEKQPVPKHFDAVVVCGMGPLELKKTKVGDNLVAKNIYNFLNGISAKILVSHDLADMAIVSGFRSQKGPQSGEPTDLQKLEMRTSEAEMLAKTYKRATPKGVSKEGLEKANKLVELDEKANTTFGNIIESVNLLDKKAGGLWKGDLAVISSEFHGPRIVEMLKMFGLPPNFLSAERIFRHFGYKGRLHPQEGWEVHEGATYAGQPENYMNLLTNPSYVTSQLALIESPQRLSEMANGFKNYTLEHNAPLPDVFKSLPKEYDPDFDYNNLKEEFKKISNRKYPFPPGLEDIKTEGVGYRELVNYVADFTDAFLEGATKK